MINPTKVFEVEEDVRSQCSARIAYLEEEVERLNNLVMMQNYTISKLSAPVENGGYSGTNIPERGINA